jgi:hypothetical protein
MEIRHRKQNEFYNWALHGNEWSPSRSERFNLRKKGREYTSDRTLGERENNFRDDTEK